MFRLSISEGKIAEKHIRKVGTFYEKGGMHGRSLLGGTFTCIV